MATLTGHQKRFAGWQKCMPPKTQYLVEQVLTRIVPEFEKNNFAWHSIDSKRVGANTIPLQRKSGNNWPTVELYFLKGVWGPRFRITFSELPETCRSIESSNIPREEAAAQFGSAYFYLERNIWHDGRDSEFGFNWMLLLLPAPSTVLRLIRYLFNWRKFLDSEVDAAIALLPILFEIFDKGIPQEWIDHDFGKINDHVMLIHSWKRLDKLKNP